MATHTSNFTDNVFSRPRPSGTAIVFTIHVSDYRADHNVPLVHLFTHLTLLLLFLIIVLYLTKLTLFCLYNIPVFHSNSTIAIAAAYSFDVFIFLLSWMLFSTVFLLWLFSLIVIFVSVSRHCFWSQHFITNLFIVWSCSISTHDSISFHFISFGMAAELDLRFLYYHFPAYLSNLLLTVTASATMILHLYIV